MIDPVWYFSTLAQATAASIGFVIAFSAALFTSRRNQKGERVNQFKRDIWQFQEDFENTITTMTSVLRECGNFEYGHGVYLQGEKASDTRDEIREWADSQPDPHCAYLYKNLQWLRMSLHKSQDATDPKEMKDYFVESEQAVLDINNELEFDDSSGDTSPMEQIFREVTKKQPKKEFDPYSHIFSSTSEDTSPLRKFTKTGTTDNRSDEVICGPGHYTVGPREKLLSRYCEQSERPLMNVTCM